MFLTCCWCLPTGDNTPALLTRPIGEGGWLRGMCAFAFSGWGDSKNALLWTPSAPGETGLSPSRYSHFSGGTHMQSNANLGWRVIVGAVMLLGLAVSATTHAARIHVDASVPVSGTGASWPLALRDLQEALDVAGSGDEIWVAAGCYVPSALTNPPDERSRTFGLITGVKIYGGFLGNAHPEGGELTLPERDPEANMTLLWIPRRRDFQRFGE